MKLKTLLLATLLIITSLAAAAIPINLGNANPANPIRLPSTFTLTPLQPNLNVNYLASSHAFYSNDGSCRYEVKTTLRAYQISAQDSSYLESTLNYSTPLQRDTCLSALLTAIRTGAKPNGGAHNECRFDYRSHNQIAFTTFPANTDVCSGAFNGRNLTVEPMPRQPQANVLPANSQETIKAKLTVLYPYVTLVNPPGCFAAISSNGVIKYVNATTGAACQSAVTTTDALNALQRDGVSVTLGPVLGCFIIGSGQNAVEIGNCNIVTNDVSPFGPSIDKIKMNVSQTNISIYFGTDMPTNYTLQVREANLAGIGSLVQTLDSSAQSYTHDVLIENLKPNQMYQLVINACTDVEATKSCVTRQITTTTLQIGDSPDGFPVFGDLVIKPVLNEILVSWNTNTPTNYSILVVNSSEDVVKEESSSTYSQRRAVNVRGLSFGTTYTVYVTVCTQAGRCTTEQRQVSTINRNLNVPPIQLVRFSNVQLITSNTSAVISWDTNFNTNTTLLAFNYSNEDLTHYLVDIRFVQNHTFTLSNLKAGAKYKFGVKACTANNTCVTMTRAFTASVDGNQSVENPYINFSILPNQTTEQEIPPSSNGGSSSDTVSSSSHGRGRSIFLKYGCEFEFNAQGTLGNCTNTTAANVTNQSTPITGLVVAKAVNTSSNQTTDAADLQPKGETENNSLIDLAIAALILLLIALVIISTAAYILYKQKKDSDAVQTASVPVAQDAASVEQPAPAADKLASIKEEVHEPAPEAATKAKK